MAPSATQTEHIMSTSISVSADPWCQQNQHQKENQRPPVFFPEDYIIALKKFSKFGSNNNSSGNSGCANKSIYDTIEDVKNEKTNGAISNKSRTLPLSKNSDYK